MRYPHRFCPQCHHRFGPLAERCPDDGATLRPDPFIGSVIGRWTIVDFLGQGAMGVVYAAERTLDPGGRALIAPEVEAAIPTRAAVKILNARRAAMQPDLVRRFEIEARAVARLESTHVARVFESGTTDDGHLYIAMERLRGSPMDRILSRVGVLEPGTAATIGYQVAQALAEAHDKQIVHRDLKPGNVFVEPLPDGAWHARVLDFGVARMTEAGVERTRTGIVAGTPSYMSPEQLRGDRDLDGRSDIYALGVLLYRLLSGTNPFQGDGSFAQAHALHLGQLPPLLPAEVPARLAAVVLGLLAKDRDDRPQSMYAVQAALLATGLIEVRGGGTAFSMDASTVVGFDPASSPPDATAPDSDDGLGDPTVTDRAPAALEPGPLGPTGRAADTVVARPAARRETTQVSIVGLPAQEDTGPVEPARVELFPAFSDTMRLPSVGEPRGGRLRIAALALLVAGAAIGTGLGLGLQAGFARGPAEAPPADRSMFAAAAPGLSGDRVEAPAEPSSPGSASSASEAAPGSSPEPVALEPAVPAVESPTPAEPAVETPAPAEPAVEIPAPPPAAPRPTLEPTRPSAPPPTGYAALLDASIIAMESGQTAQAIALLEAARDLRPGSAVPYQRLCELQARVGRHEDALYSCRDWRAREPKARYRDAIDRRIEGLLSQLNR